jgi:thymidine kinase
MSNAYEKKRLSKIMGGIKVNPLPPASRNQAYRFDNVGDDEFDLALELGFINKPASSVSVLPLTKKAIQWFTPSGKFASNQQIKDFLNSQPQLKPLFPPVETKKQKAALIKAEKPANTIRKIYNPRVSNKPKVKRVKRKPGNLTGFYRDRNGVLRRPNGTRANQAERNYDIQRRFPNVIKPTEVVEPLTVSLLKNNTETIPYNFIIKITVDDGKPFEFKRGEIQKLYVNRQLTDADETEMMMQLKHFFIFESSEERMNVVAYKAQRSNRAEDILKSPMWGRCTYTLNQAGFDPVRMESPEDCVPLAIERTMGKSTPKDLLKQLNMPTRTNGCTADQLILFCIKHEITIGLCDMAYNIITHKKSGSTAIYGLIQTEGAQGHLYRITDANLIKHIFAPKEINNIKQLNKLSCKKCKINFVSHIEYTEHLLIHEKRIVVHVPDLHVAAKDFIKDTKTIPKFSISGHFFTTSTHKYIHTDDHKFEYKGTRYPSITNYAKSIITDLYLDRHMSVCNEATMNIFNHSTTPYIQQFTPNHKSYEYDLSKCYTAILYDYEMPVYTYLDRPELFNGEIKPCSFYGVLNAGQIQWIISDLLEFYIDAKRYDASNIKLQLVSKEKINFKSYVDFIYKQDLTTQEKKESINNIIGTFAQTERTKSINPIITTSESDFWHIKNNAKNSTARNITSYSLEFPTLAVHYISETLESHVNARPIWHYITQISRLKMEMAADHITKQGGLVNEIKTDAIYTNCNITIPKLFMCEYGDWKPAKMCKARKPTTYNQKPFPVTQDERIETSDYIGGEFDPTHGLYITGAPGTGKSTLWRALKKTIEKTTVIKTVHKVKRERLINGILKKKGETYEKIKRTSNVAELSFQNNVVANIGEHASTFHKVLNMKQTSKEVGCLLAKKFKHIKYIFIDEIQQTPAEVVPYLIWLKDNLNIIFYCAGDFDQWPNIKHKFDESANWLKRVTDNYKKTLTVNFRNPDMANIHKWHLKTPTTLLQTIYYIAYYNDVVNEINNRKYLAHPVGQSVPFVCCRGNRSLGFTKGRHYLLTDRIIQLDPAFHSVHGHNGETYQQAYQPEYGVYFTLGFAFTCHKTIGLTINQPYTIIEHRVEYFCPLVNNRVNHSAIKEVKKIYDYVARSRANNKDQLYTWTITNKKDFCNREPTLDDLVREELAEREKTRKINMVRPWVNQFKELYKKNMTSGFNEIWANMILEDLPDELLEFTEKQCQEFYDYEQLDDGAPDY